MKKYLLLAALLILSFSLIGGVYADDDCGIGSYCAQKDSKGSCLSCKQKTSACSSNGPNDPSCLSSQESSQIAAQKMKADCASSVGKAGTDSCSKSYSCDSLFTDHATATKCNYDRCLKERGGASDSDGYCNCKYGNNGDGKSVGIPLNTSIPFVGKCSGRASNTTDSALSAFPSIIQAASRILVTVILLMGFIMIVVGGVQRASGDAKSGKEKITKVAVGFALLGMMGAILRLINPNFFK